MQAQIQRLQELIDNASQNELRQLQEVFFLTDFWPVLPFYRPWKLQKTQGFFGVFSGNIGKKWVKVFLIFLYIYIWTDCKCERVFYIKISTINNITRKLIDHAKVKYIVGSTD